ISATPLARGAGLLSSLVQADGLICVPSSLGGVEAGRRVTIQLATARRIIERTLLALGAHDAGLDLLAEHLARQLDPEPEAAVRLVAVEVGSQGGLAALEHGHAHLAGCVLLDPESGEYNRAAVRRYLPLLPAVVVAMAARALGLLVP